MARDVLGPRQRAAIEHVQQTGSGCSAHHVDLGVISRSEERPQHEALRRLARRSGIYKPNAWIGALTLRILRGEL